MFINSKSQDVAKWHKSLDTYLATWDDAIRNIEENHPVENRSQLTITMLEEMKKLLGNKQAAVVSDQYKGDPTYELKFETRNFTDRVFENQGTITSPIRSKDKMAFIEYVAGGELKPVVSMLRLYSMIEFEVPTLMYALTVKSWLKMSETTVMNGARWEDVEKAMQEVCDKITQISTERAMTDRLFHSSWLQARRLIGAEKNLEDATEKLEGLKDAVQQQGRQDKKNNSAADRIIEELEASCRTLADTGRKILTRSEASEYMPQFSSPTTQSHSQKNTPSSSGLLHSLFSTTMSQRLSQDAVKSVRANSAQYEKVRNYLLQQAGTLESDMSKVQALIGLYSQEQQNNRKRYFLAARQWQSAYTKEMDNLTSLQDPMHLKNFWQRDSREERILAIRNDKGSLWHALTSAIIQTSPTYCGTPSCDEEKEYLAKKITNKDNAAEWRKHFVEYQATTNKNQRLSQKWFSVGGTLMVFGFGVLATTMMFGELSKSGAALLTANAPAAIGILITYVVLCAAALWRSSHLHNKNFEARKKIVESLTGKNYEEKSWLGWLSKRDLSINRTAPVTASSAEIRPEDTQIDGQQTEVRRDVGERLQPGRSIGRYGQDAV